MALREVAKPSVRIDLDEDGETVLAVTAVPGPAASAIIDLSLRSISKDGMMPFGQIVQEVLRQCRWDVEGPVLDAEGEEVTDPTRRRGIAERAVITDVSLSRDLAMDVMGYLGAVSPNWRTASDLATGAVQVSGMGSE
jgi:hypothetical protein